MAVLLPVIFGVGIYMHDLPLTPWKLQIYSWHKWAGVTVFLLVLLRFSWRLTHCPPALPSTMSPALRFAAHAGHGLLYALMIAIPVTGWLMSSAKGFQTVYFGILPIPDLLAKNQALGDLLREVHAALNFLLAAVVVGHVAAALKHHLVDGDDVLRRILPRRDHRSDRDY
jgi:cytochrome b561